MSGRPGALDDDTVYVGHRTRNSTPLDLSEIRRALREQRKLRITLAIEHAPKDQQVVWPIMLGLIEGSRFIAAWCEMDSQFRVIAMGDIATAEILTERYPRNRRQLVREWRAQDVRPCNSQGDAC